MCSRTINPVHTHFTTANFHLTWEHSSLQFYRVHGTKIAKIPLVETREKLRSGDYKGTMMLKLFAQIESAPGKLNVENLVIQTASATASAATKTDEANKNGTGLVRGKGYEKLAFFDLNLEPPKEDDDA
ncbi:hypothetical protein WN944_013522 [Citrus x changshan-huyou]|uniref:Increased DNA methylation 1 C-terminal domain-containing protein n=1 Tax=Citrus x changshan-huyou TaxID=2935761 RepID=A0AAP0M420_9ROSI